MWTIQTSNQGSGGWVACPPEGTHGYYVIFHYGSDEVLKAAAQEYADFKMLRASSHLTISQKVHIENKPCRIHD